VRGPLSVDDGSYQASKLWETAPKDISITVQFPHGGEFNFSEGSHASDYLEGDAVKMSAERNGQVIPAAEWARLGMKPFSLRLIAYLDKMSNRSEPKIKFTMLFFPATKGKMEELSDRVRGPESKYWKATRSSSQEPPSADGAARYTRYCAPAPSSGRSQTCRLVRRYDMQYPKSSPQPDCRCHAPTTAP
jgi:hypothetical protein